MSGQGQGGEGSHNASNSHLASPSMVSPTPPNVDRGTSPDPSELQHSPVPPNAKPNNEISRVEGLRRPSQQLAFQRKQKNYSLDPENLVRDQLMTVPGISGLADVIQGKLILFQHLWPLS